MLLRWQEIELGYLPKEWEAWPRVRELLWRFMAFLRPPKYHGGKLVQLFLL